MSDKRSSSSSGNDSLTHRKRQLEVELLERRNKAQSAPPWKRRSVVFPFATLLMALVGLIIQSMAIANDSKNLRTKLDTALAEVERAHAEITKLRSEPWSAVPEAHVSQIPQVLDPKTLWCGTSFQEDQASGVPMVLYVRSREGEQFTATAWYPEYGNGLLQMSGRVAQSGRVNMTGTKSLSGTVKAGARYEGQLDSSNLRCTGDWVNELTQALVRLRFELARSK